MGFAHRDTLKKTEETFRDAEAAGGWHAVFKRFYIFMIKHLRLSIACFAQF